MHSATPAHDMICPGYNKTGIKGFQPFSRHVIPTPDLQGEGDKVEEEVKQEEKETSRNQSVTW